MSTETVPQFRLAQSSDMTRLLELVNNSISTNLKDYLLPEQVEASYELMGVDTQLIEDQTYFVAEADGQIVGCGGWSMRATLFGGNHTPGRDAKKLDPKKDGARIRGIYTDPNYLRRGIASKILILCNASAKRAGFKSLDLMATVSGEPMFIAHGFSVLEHLHVATSNGVKVPLARMRRQVI